jgi:hypothetical protein
LSQIPEKTLGFFLEFSLFSQVGPLFQAKEQVLRFVFELDKLLFISASNHLQRARHLETHKLDELKRTDSRQLFVQRRKARSLLGLEIGFDTFFSGFVGTVPNLLKGP